MSTATKSHYDLDRVKENGRISFYIKENEIKALFPQSRKTSMIVLADVNAITTSEKGKTKLETTLINNKNLKMTIGLNDETRRVKPLQGRSTQFDSREIRFSVGNNPDGKARFLGMTREEVKPHLSALTNGKYTEVIPITHRDRDAKEVTKTYDGRVRLIRDLQTNTVRTQTRAKSFSPVKLDKISNHELTQEERTTLQNGDNILINISTRNHEDKQPYIFALDKETNTLNYIKQDNFRVPKKMLGKTLSEKEQNILKSGGVLKLEVENEKTQTKQTTQIKLDPTKGGLNFYTSPRELANKLESKQNEALKKAPQKAKTTSKSKSNAKDKPQSIPPKTNSRGRG